MSRRSGMARLAMTLAALVLVAGCSPTSPLTAPSTTVAPSTLDQVTVAGGSGDKPRLSFPKPFSVTETGKRVIKEGEGQPLSAGLNIRMHYLGVNGTDGKEFDTSYGRQEQTPFVLDPQQVIRGMVEGLSGVNVGSRVLIAVPPADGYGTQGVPAAGIGPTDTLVFVVDVKSAATPLKRATGTPVAPKGGLPGVKLDRDGKPAITIPNGAPPKTLVVQPLITGKGAKVQKNQTITVHYTGVIWPGGKEFDSSWAKGSPASFPIGVGRVIAGWDEGLVGRTVGSQVLLVIPPDKGYGAAGSPQAGIKGTDTLVFVVDILDAA